MKLKLLFIGTIAMLNAQDNIITEYNSPPPGMQLEQESPLDNTNQTNQEKIQTAPMTNHNHDHSHDHDSILNSFYGHVGIFGKTNMLGKENDSYGVFSASMGLTYNVQDMLYFGLGIYGMTPFMEYPSQTHNAKNYVHSKFITNNAYAKYIAEGFFSITGGRYHEDRDWLRHYVQGIGIDINYNWISVWGNWVDEQAHANREHVHDFDVYKTTYNKQWLAAGGINVNLFGIEIEPQYYYLNNIFWSVGGKIALDIDISENWNSTTTLHYVSLHAKTDHVMHAHGDHAHEKDLGNSSIFWAEEALKYSLYNSSILFGAGFTKVWKSYFELANIGNTSRFETHSHTGYDVIEPGGIENGKNTTNMFDANTRTIYGFVGFEIDKFSLMFLGRNSKSKEERQDQYSLGAKWNIIEGVYIGGVGVYMMENKRNMSFAKGYIEFAI
ncbi:hypothetical protein CCY99_08315 [Helicobacter sp. 16-1353]|uniref:outer membrane family protein n=1 Tax=Helicobacter sp. 16-1353 TaxID=2004996 RepID=UPI000DCE64D0|nr:outer membrane family protein [Helicobacter sp. 16-1353]RAX51794.1 hypothetical protein CCY99_08315 [Helicobacter sp. 16-1353]